MLSRPSRVRAEDHRDAIQKRRARPWQVAVIEQAVARLLGVAPPAFRSASRGTATIAHARQIAMYLARTKLELSYAAIGHAFCRDRTTVAHACRTIEELREQGPVDDLLAKLEDALEPRLAACGLIVGRG